MASSTFRFGEFRLDPARRELWRGDEEVALPPKAFGCLVHLVENRDRAVGRDELIDAVWHKANLADSVLGQAIVDVRRALGDSGEEHKYIQTVRGFGYRWAAPVEPVEPETTAGEITRDRRRAPKRAWVLAAALALIALTAAYLLRGVPPGDTGAAHQRITEDDIALLLPVAVEAREHHPWIRLGVMDLIAARLREAGQPMVPSDTVIALLNDHTAEPKAEEVDRIEKTTGAGLVLTASAEARGGRWRVSLRSLRGLQPPLAVHAEAEEVLDAARSAADRMALSLGLKPAPRPNTEPGLATLLQQAEAALLAQQPDIVRELLESADAARLRHPRVRLLSARLALHERDLDAAQAGLESLLREPAVGRDAVLMATVLHGLSAVHFRRGDYGKARPILERAVRVLGGSGRADALARLGRIQLVLGTILVSSGDPEAAQEPLARARLALESTGDVQGLAYLDNNLGLIEVLRNRDDQAIDSFRRSADARAALHDVGGELRARANLIETLLRQLEVQAARALEPRLDELLAQTTNLEIRAQGNLAKAALLDATGRSEAFESVLAEVMQAVGRREDLPEVWTWARALHAEHLLREGDAAGAADAVADVIEQIPGNDNRFLENYLGRAGLVSVRARLYAGDLEAAERIAATMRAWAERWSASTPRAYAAMAAAEVAAADGPPAAAAAAFEQAIAAADATRAPDRVLQAAESYVDWLLGGAARDSRNLDRALLVANRVVRNADQSYRASLLQLRVYHALDAAAAWRRTLTRTRSLAGERGIPQELQEPP